jgi:hypothetical protein
MFRHFTFWSIGLKHVDSPAKPGPSANIRRLVPLIVGDSIADFGWETVYPTFKSTFFTDEMMSV